ncbi:hypothetical protein [Klebsiella pneumoniae]|uniref:PTS sugar transporter subunit IIA domain-containing protein n=1 Tax=Klebsiella pneumoniae TaxID=573 RepID=UPI00132F8301|nr:hypothetical protein [Klebsiella pneumoniae]
MTIAIVIGTHGWAAEQLLKTAEMLLGEQEKLEPVFIINSPPLSRNHSSATSLQICDILRINQC